MRCTAERAPSRRDGSGCAQGVETLGEHLEGEVLATQGNYNNELGLPLSLFELEEGHRYAVLEMGASKSGDIGYLARIARELPAVPAGETLYSDLGYLLLGMVIEEVTGQPLDRLFHDRVVRVLGEPRIGFTSGDYTDAAATEQGNSYERLLAGAEGEAHPWRTAIPRGEVHDANAWGLGGVAGHAGLFGTIEAVATVARELLYPTRLPLGDAQRDALLRQRPGAEGRTVGMVVASYSRATSGILPPAAPGHTGFTGTSMWLDPASGRFFVLLTNRVHPVVERRDFQIIRRGFHRLATRVAGGTDPALPLE